jgi:hypothetical protein
MLEYIKTILQKVSFDSNLFEKELKKALKTLVTNDVDRLREWCYQQFSDSYKPVLDSCFTKAKTELI